MGGVRIRSVVPVTLPHQTLSGRLGHITMPHVKTVASELPHLANTRYELPGLARKIRFLLGREERLSGTTQIRQLSTDDNVAYMSDGRADGRDGFLILRGALRQSPLFVPMAMLRLLAAEVKNVVSTTKHDAAIPRKMIWDPVMREGHELIPQWTHGPHVKLTPSGMTNVVPRGPFDFMNGVAINNPKTGESWLIPWVDGWETHSPLAFDPVKEGVNAWMVPQGWNNGYPTLNQRQNFAANLMGHVPRVESMADDERAGLVMLAAVIGSSSMDFGITSWAMRAVASGPSSSSYLARAVAGLLNVLPSQSVVTAGRSDGKTTFDPDFVKRLEDLVIAAHDAFPAISHRDFLFPRELPPFIQQTSTR